MPNEVLGSLRGVVIPLHDDNPTHRRAVVTLVIIAINVFVYFVVQPHGGDAEAEFTLERAAIPCELEQGSPLTPDEYLTGECDAEEPAIERRYGDEPIDPGKNVWLAVFTSMFLHGSFVHLAGNMLFLWIFGNNVEDHLGPFLFVPFYLLLGVAGMTAHYLADPGSTVPIIGASGAIAGLMGAYLVLWPRARILTYIPLLLFVVVYLPAGVVLGIWFGMQFFTNPNEGVAWLAHVGGFGAGIVLGFAIRAVLPPKRRGPLPLER